MSNLVNLNKIDIFSFLYVLIIDVYLVLLAPKLSGYEVDFTSVRVSLLIITFTLVVIAVLGTLLKGRLSTLVISVSAYVLYIVMSVYFFTDSDVEMEILFSVLYGPIIFIGAICVFRNINERTFNLICELKFGFLVFYAGLFLYSSWVGDRQNGPFINTVYFQLALIPFVLMLRNSWKVYGGLLLVILSALLVGKRTVLFLGLCSIFFFVLFNANKHRFISQILKISASVKVLVVSVCIIVFIQLSLSFDIGGVDRIITAFDDGGSGRLLLLELFFDALGRFGVRDYFFGFGIGFSSSFMLGEHSVHNDFLEVLFRLGIFGVFLYLAIGFIVLRHARKIRQRNSYLGSVLLFSLFIFALLSMVSMLIFIPSYIAQFFIFWSFITRKSIADIRLTKAVINGS